MSFRPTDEQAEAIRVAASGETFVLDAPAGSGKSSTARGMAKQIDGRVLYLVYNRAAKEDAVRSFPRSTVVKTTSQLAWASYASEYADRMRPGEASRVPSWETARMAGIKPVDLGGDITRPLVAVEGATSTLDGLVKFGNANAELRAIVDQHATKLRIWPAARTVHHAYRSGLLEHILKIMEVSLFLADQYGAKRDLLIAGALLHDIGKLSTPNEILQKPGARWTTRSTRSCAATPRTVGTSSWSWVASPPRSPAW